MCRMWQETKFSYLSPSSLDHTPIIDLEVLWHWWPRTSMDAQQDSTGTSTLKTKIAELMNYFRIARKETSRIKRTVFSESHIYFLLQHLKLVNAKKFFLSELLGWEASTLPCLFAHLQSLWQQAINILSNNHKVNQKVYRWLELGISATLCA